MKTPSEKNVSFDVIIAALLDESKVLPPTYLYRLSDLSGPDFEKTKVVWNQISPARRRALLEDLEELSDNDLTLSFDDLAFFTLEDPDDQVRTLAVRMLWQYEDKHLAPILLKMISEDPSESVRSAAATGLGMFVYLGELEEIPVELAEEVQNKLTEIVASTDTKLVRRHALESLGYSNRPEVKALIENAFRSDKEWEISALFAMGRTADPVQWGEKVLSKIDSPLDDVRTEAIRAAGELELEEAREPLMDLLGEGAEDLDEDLRFTAIWSLSQIGGEGVRDLLEHLEEETEDDEESDFIADALDNLSFTEEKLMFDMFGFDPSDTSAIEMDLDEKDLEEDEDQDPKN
ncbi:MAG: HEAT repeat domain-containing protein [Anaerolineaceae bacterium]